MSVMGLPKYPVPGLARCQNLTVTVGYFNIKNQTRHRFTDLPYLRRQHEIAGRVTRFPKCKIDTLKKAAVTGELHADQPGN